MTRYVSHKSLIFFSLKMAKSLSDNEVINIANNYGYLYSIHTIHKELKTLLKLRGNNKFFIYKLLCRNLRRILGEGVAHFKAELNYDQNTKLVEDISENYFIRVIQRKRYSDNSEMCITFVDKIKI